MLTIAPTRRLSRSPWKATGGLLFSLPAGTTDDPAARERRGAESSGRASCSAAAVPPEELAHDARNFLSAVNLYCELLAAPGVLTHQFRHYAPDLRQLGRTGGRLLEQLAEAVSSAPERRAPLDSHSSPAMELEAVAHPFPPIEDLADELLSLESPLRTIAGPDVRLEVECAPCAGRLALNSEALLRILFNLVANTVEAMHSPSAPNRRKFIRVTAQRGQGGSFLPSADFCAALQSPKTVLLSIRDNGPGIAPDSLPRIFESGFSTRPATDSPDRFEDAESSGRGLAIVRRLVEAAGGAVRAVSSLGFGTRFDIELPIAPAPACEIRLAAGNRTSAKPGAQRKFRILSTNRESGV